MKRRMMACLVLIGAGASWIGLAHPSASDPAGADASAGRKLFGQNCSRCHGLNMLNPAPGVFDLRTFPPDDKARFVDSVTQGKGAMPAWKAVLTPEEIDALWSYIRAGHEP